MNKPKYDKAEILEIAIPLKLEGYSYREIAKIVDIPKSTLHRYFLGYENIIKGSVTHGK